MKKLTIIAASLIILFFSACSGGNNEKRIVVMVSGKLTVTDKTIQLEPSLTHNEQELIFKDDKLTLTVQSTGVPNKTFDLTDNGVYVLNLQTDTLTGGIVNYGTSGRPGSITAEQLDHIIDSTQQLLQGTNTSDAKGTYFLPPFTIKKVSAKTNTKIIGSFKGIPYSNEADNSGMIPDVVKFFTNKQKRETLNDLMDQKTKMH
ncbi:MAG: hypothetical protein NVSMB7_00440 [Chitinophagaceae bacterium]